MAVMTVARELGARGSRAIPAGPDPAGPPAPAAAAVLAAVPGWWAGRVAAVGLACPWTDVTEAVHASPPLDVLGGTPDPAVTPELSGHALGQAYVDALEAGVRARHGRHYTPPDLAGRVWDSARVAWGFGAAARVLPGLVRDPAAGAGSLLLPPLREHLRASVRADPAVVMAALSQLVEGLDADPYAAWLGSVILAAELLPLLAALPAVRRRPLPGLVRVGDGLAAAMPPAGAVVMNPPYGRVKLDEADRARFAHLLRGHPNLYSLFMGHALETLDRGGVMAALVPTSFTAGSYFAPLRAALSSDASLRSVTWVPDRGGTFSGVLQETCVATVSKAPSTRTTIAVSNGAIHPVAEVATPRTSGPWLLPRRADDAPTAAGAAAMPNTLTSVGWRVSTGPLVWNRRKSDLHPRPGKGRHRVLWGADIATGAVVQHRGRNSMRFLAVHGERDERTMVLGEPAVLVQRTTAPEQTRRLVATDLPPEVLRAWGGTIVVENHVNVLRPLVAEPLLDRATLAAVLATDTLDSVMRSTAGSVAVSAYEFASLRFPAADVMATWQGLDGDELARAVVAAYHGGRA